MHRTPALTSRSLDAMAGREPSMTPPEMREALTELQRRAEAADEAVPEESSKTDDDGAE